MKPLELFAFSLSGWFFLFLLGWATSIKDSTWATAAITGILVLITAYYAMSTEKILRVNAHYATTTDAILEVNRKTLELLIMQKRTAKVEEIIKTIFLPLDKKIIRLQNEIQKKSNIIAVDPMNDRIPIQSLIHDIYEPQKIEFLTTMNYVKFQFESIKIDTNYEDPTFQKSIQQILRDIIEFDNEQKEYEDFVKNSFSLLCTRILYDFQKKMESNHNYFIARHLMEDLFRSLMISKIDENAKMNIRSIKPSDILLKEFPILIEECYHNNSEFQTLIKQKLEFEERLLKNLNELSTDLNSLLSNWMNEYHIVITD